MPLIGYSTTNLHFRIRLRSLEWASLIDFLILLCFFLSGLHVTCCGNNGGLGSEEHTLGLILLFHAQKYQPQEVSKRIPFGLRSSKIDPPGIRLGTTTTRIRSHLQQQMCQGRKPPLGTTSAKADPTLAGKAPKIPLPTPPLWHHKCQNGTSPRHVPRKGAPLFGVTKGLPFYHGPKKAPGTTNVTKGTPLNSTGVRKGTPWAT